MSVNIFLYQFPLRIRLRLPSAICGVLFFVLFLLPFHGGAQVSDTSKPMADTTVQAADTGSTSTTVGKEDEPSTTEVVSVRDVPDSAWRKFRSNPDFAYANDPSYWKKEPDNNENNFDRFFYRVIGSPWTRGIVYVLLTGLLLFALYRIVVENKLYLFYSAPKKNTIGDSNDAEDTEENLEEKIRQAEQAREFRLATRYRYLKALRMLSDKGLIRYRAQATDTEYLSQLEGSQQSAGFALLTRVYEYVWYGGFGLSSMQFGEVKQYFEEFYNTLLV